MCVKKSTRRRHNTRIYKYTLSFLLVIIILTLMYISLLDIYSSYKSYPSYIIRIRMDSPLLLYIIYIYIYIYQYRYLGSEVQFWWQSAFDRWWLIIRPTVRGASCTKNRMRELVEFILNPKTLSVHFHSWSCTRCTVCGHPCFIKKYRGEEWAQRLSSVCCAKLTTWWISFWNPAERFQYPYIFSRGPAE